MYISTTGPFNMLCNLRVNLDDFGNPLYSTWLEQIYQSCQIWSCIEDQAIPQVRKESNSAFYSKDFYYMCPNYMCPNMRPSNSVTVICLRNKVMDYQGLQMPL